MRKVFLEDLPKRSTFIDWKNSKGCKVKGIYDDVNFEMEIIEYEQGYLHLKYLDKPIFKITTDGFKRCKLGVLLGVYTKEFKVKIEQVFKDDKRDLVITNREYRNKKHGKSNVCEKWYKYTCNKCGWTEGWIDESNLLNHKIGCSCCDNKVVVQGINDIPTTAPWMIPFFQGGIDEAKLYTKTVAKKIIPICPDCGRIKDKPMNISTICKRKLIGCFCNDKKSYPEKLLVSMLNQLDINFTTEYSPDWIKPKRYDFYMPKLKLIIETHGLQHYEEKGRKGGRNLKEEQYNDKLKKDLALKNGVKEENYIVIDCRYSELEFIKQNILNSRLSEMFDLTIVDWLKCEEFALSNLVKEVCYYWDNGIKSTKEIANIMKMNRSTITDYLKKGATIWSWCTYNPKEELTKSNKKNGKLKGKRIICLETSQEFPSASELEKISKDLLGVNLYQPSISNVCNGKSASYKGFTFKYI